MANIEGWRGKWALVTGASSGIGWAIAEELAAGGAHLVLTARRRPQLMELRKKLRAAHEVKIEVVTADLAQSDAAETIFQFTEEHDIAIDLLVNNAGTGAYGAFSGSRLESQLNLISLNCAAVVHLTHLYLPGMLERHAGDILIVASTAAFQGVPFMATYAATKAFDLLLAEALAEEVREQGVRVCALCPGPTRSEFIKSSGLPEDLAGQMEQTAAEVARTGLRGLASGEVSVISGLTNWIGVEIERLLPRRLATYAAGRLFRPRE